MHNARPLHHLERMLLQNQRFGDDVALAGLCNPQNPDLRITTTQPDLAMFGAKADLDPWSAAFTQATSRSLVGQELVTPAPCPFARSRQTSGTSIPPNVLITEDGLPLPFDVMITLNGAGP